VYQVGIKKELHYDARPTESQDQQSCQVSARNLTS